MKAALFHKKHDIRLEEVAKPIPREDEVIVKVEACGVCGTDMHICEGAEGAAKTTPPTILGHEFSGIVHQVGVGVKSFKVGDRVCVDPNNTCGSCYYCKTGKAHFCENMVGYGTTVDGGFAEFCAVSEKQLYSIPDSLSFEEGAMAEPLACCLHGLDLTDIKTGDTVMVIGGGTIGQIMLQLARISGAANLILVEPVAEKRQLALKLGADITVDPTVESIHDVLVRHSIKQVDRTIECVGLRKTMEDAITYVGKGGTAMLFGLTHPSWEIPLMPFEVFKREITIRASFINPYTQSRAVSLLASGKINVKELITDVVDIKNINDIFDTEKYKGRGKIIVRP